MTSRALFSFLGCGLLGSFLSAGCSDNEALVPRVEISSSLKSGNTPENNMLKCKLRADDQWVGIRRSSPGEDQSTSVDSGTQNFDGRDVGVACSITANGDGFQVNANAALSGVGSVTIIGLMRPSGAAPQPGIQGSFQKGDTGNFSDMNCTVTFDRPGMGIGAGKVWGTLTCPLARDASQDNRTCAASAEFKFERCSS